MFPKYLIFGVILFPFAAAENNCSSVEWQCTDGNCVTAEARCDGAFQCPDASDERLALCRGTRRPMLGLILHCVTASGRYQGLCPEVCHLQPQYCSYALLTENETNNTCSLPQFPENGHYIVQNPNRTPQHGLADLFLKFSCKGGWNLKGEQIVQCKNGTWTRSFPTCVQANCGELSSNYTLMNVTKEVRTVMSVPWHVGVFKKAHPTSETAMQICGGTLITSGLVVSAASCFWDEDMGRLFSVKRFVIAAGKFKRSLEDSQDIYGQTSEVSAVNLPSDFKAEQNNYHSDISAVLLKTPFILTNYVRPVCLGAPPYVYGHLQTETKLAGWGPVNGDSNADLKIHDVSTLWSCPSKDIADDQICGNFTEGTACIGDVGCGIVSRDASGLWRLRGVISLYSKSCRDHEDFVITRLEDHEHFLKGFL